MLGLYGNDKEQRQRPSSEAKRKMKKLLEVGSLVNSIPNLQGKNSKESKTANTAPPSLTSIPYLFFSTDSDINTFVQTLVCESSKLEYDSCNLFNLLQVEIMIPRINSRSIVLSRVLLGCDIIVRCHCKYSTIIVYLIQNGV